MAIAQDLKDALDEFTELTNKTLPKLTKEGQASSAKKVGGLIKLKKTVLVKLADDFDKAIIGKDLAKIQSARKKLTDQLKVFSADFAKQGAQAATDASMKTGLDVMSKRLTSFALHAKMAAEQKEVGFKQNAGTLSLDEALKKDIRQVYLGIRKGADETEALMKKFIAKPTEANFMAAFASGTGPRSIGASVTYWKKRVVPKLPASFNVTQTLGEDPEKLIRRIWEITQRHEKGEFWEQYLGYGKDGWEAKATREAKGTIQWMTNWRAVADKMKAFSNA